MVKTIHFKVTDELYYNLVSLKAQTHTNSWEELMKHITQPKQPNSPQPEQPQQLKQPEQTTNPKRSLDTKNQKSQKG